MIHISEFLLSKSNKHLRSNIDIEGIVSKLCNNKFNDYLKDVIKDFEKKLKCPEQKDYVETLFNILDDHDFSGYEFNYNGMIDNMYMYTPSLDKLKQYKKDTKTIQFTKNVFLTSVMFIDCSYPYLLAVDFYVSEVKIHLYKDTNFNDFYETLEMGDMYWQTLYNSKSNDLDGFEATIKYFIEH